MRKIIAMERLTRYYSVFHGASRRQEKCTTQKRKRCAWLDLLVGLDRCQVDRAATHHYHLEERGVEEEVAVVMVILMEEQKVAGKEGGGGSGKTKVRGGK